MRVLSGIQPSGRLHLGNYLGMMKRMIEYQESSTLFAFLVNLHALTTVTDGEFLRKSTLEAAADFLALGLDPEKSIFWVQSDVPEVTELSWYLSNHTPMGLLERCHSFKDKVARGVSANHGLFAYPVLMTADILLYQANIVPVGKDQKQHVEVARDIAIKFNNAYGDVFALPEPEIEKDLATVLGIDGQKMSKSYDNTIEIFADEKALKKKVMSIVTDSTPLEEPKDPDKDNVFAIYRLFATPEQTEEMRQKYISGGYGYGHAKKDLYELLLEHFRPHRAERERLLADETHIRKVLKDGAEKARAEAEITIRKVREAVGINY
ncbi:MAG: tryptophan--tRNA ligase [Candidatus Eisenbacteria sp.]|nr:tryptophan--tRNA ligase [Candidatus Eisenbacteria bacterium]